MAKVLKGSSVSLVVFGNQYENNDDRKKKKKKDKQTHIQIFFNSNAVYNCYCLLLLLGTKVDTTMTVWTFQNQFHGKSKGSVPPFLFGHRMVQHKHVWSILTDRADQPVLLQ